MRSSTTIIFIGLDRLVRADYSGGGRLRRLIQRPRPESDDPHTLIGAVLSADSSRLSRKTYLLSTDVWTNVLELPSATTKGMNGAELTQALCFESEPLSGINAFDAASAIQPVGADGLKRRFWFTQISAAIYEQYDEAIRAGGGRLAGVAHPGGLPVPIVAAQKVASWHRIEFWNGALVRMSFHNGALGEMRIDGEVAASLSARRAAVEAWRAEAGKALHEEALVAGPVENADELGGIALSLEDDAVLTEWLSEWRRAIGSRKPGLPLIPPLARASTRDRSLLVTAVLTLLAIGGCFAHSRWVDGQLRAMAQEQAELQKPGLEVTAIKQQITKLAPEVAQAGEELNKIKTDVELADTVIAWQQHRIAALLEHLALARSDDWVLQKIDGRPGEISLHGVTIHPERISALATELAKGLEKYGWSVRPPRQSAQIRQDDGAPWTFELQLYDVELKTKGSSFEAAPPMGDMS